MALQNFQYDRIMREYNRRQAAVQHDLETRQKDAYAKIPRLAEIDREVASLSAGKARALLSGQSDSTADLRCQVAKLSAERLSLLKVKGFPEDYLQPVISALIARIPAMQTAKNAPASKKQRSNCFIPSLIWQIFSKKKILNTFLLTGILIQ